MACARCSTPDPATARRRRSRAGTWPRPPPTRRTCSHHPRRRHVPDARLVRRRAARAGLRGAAARAVPGRRARSASVAPYDATTAGSERSGPPAWARPTSSSSRPPRREPERSKSCSAGTDRDGDHPRRRARRARRSAVAGRRRGLHAATWPTIMVEGMRTRHAARHRRLARRRPGVHGAVGLRRGVDRARRCWSPTAARTGWCRQQHGHWLAAHLPRHEEVLALDHGHLSLMSDPALAARPACSRSA